MRAKVQRIIETKECLGEKNTYRCKFTPIGMKRLNILEFEYHRLTWTELDVLVDQNGTSGGYVDGLLCISNDFRIAGNIQS